MVITPHAIIGALAGRNARYDYDAFARGAATHFALDRIPHYDYNMKTGKGLLLLADAVVAAVLVRLLAGSSRRAALGALGGIAPDIAQVGERHFDITIHRHLHSANHTDARPGPIAGTATQIITVIAAGALLKQQKEAAEQTI